MKIFVNFKVFSHISFYFFDDERFTTQMEGEVILNNRGELSPVSYLLNQFPGSSVTHYMD